MADFFYLATSFHPMQQSTYHLIIGSNLGDRENQLILAKKGISEEVGNVIKESGVYETQPWGHDDQPWFLNQALEVSSSFPPLEVLKKIKHIEVIAGRQPGEKWHARHIDIDILLCGDMILRTEELSIPHPLLPGRNFVLVPLLDLAPDFIHPILGKTIEELYLDSRDTGEVYIFSADEQGNPL